MATIDEKVITKVENEMLDGKEIKMIRRRLYGEKFKSNQIDKIIIAAKEQLHLHVAELKDILPDLNLWRLNHLYVSNVNAAPRDRAAIVKEINTMLGLYNQTVDLNVKYNFVITEDDEVEPEE